MVRTRAARFAHNTLLMIISLVSAVSAQLWSNGGDLPLLAGTSESLLFAVIQQTVVLPKLARVVPAPAEPPPHRDAEFVREDFVDQRTSRPASPASPQRTSRPASPLSPVLSEDETPGGDRPATDNKHGCWPATRLWYWNKDDLVWFNAHGRSIAVRNLAISVFNLTLAFCVWLVWSVIATSIQRVHDDNPSAFRFVHWHDANESTSAADYGYLVSQLPAIAGLSGATLRLPHSFMVSVVGGRNLNFLSAAFMIIPMIWAGIILRDKDVRFTSLAICAAFSGAGGGLFSSSTSNISFFFPKAEAGLAQGLNAGIGNLGVALIQAVGPKVVDGGFSGGAVGGKHVADAALWLVPPLFLAMILAFFGMNNIPWHRSGGTAAATVKFLLLQVEGFVVVTVGVIVILTTFQLTFFKDNSFAVILRVAVLAVTMCVLEVFLLRFTPLPVVQQNIRKRFAVFSNPHTWSISFLYTMTFGSFIGFSSAFPLFILNLFGYLPSGLRDPDARDPFQWAWLGAFVGSVSRPLGGWAADRFGGALVTQCTLLAMVACTATTGVLVQRIHDSDTPDDEFTSFLCVFLLLFTLSGVGNGAVFRMVAVIFRKRQAGPVLGWVSAVAAYGAYVVPSLFGEAMRVGSPATPFWGFTGAYVSALLLNGWVYIIRNGEQRDPEADKGTVLVRAAPDAHGSSSFPVLPNAMHTTSANGNRFLQNGDRSATNGDTVS